MNRRTRRVHAWTTLLSLCCAAASAAAEGWRYETEAAPERDVYPYGVLALPEGGFLVSNQSTYPSWLVRYSAQGQALERQPEAEYYGDIASRSAANGQALVVYFPPIEGLDDVAANHACRLTRSAFDLRRFSDWILPGAPGDGLGADGRQFGLLNSFSGPNEMRRAVLFGRDCHITEIYRARNAYNIQPIPGNAGAYLVEPVSEPGDNYGGHVLRRIGIGGVLWERKIAPPLSGNHPYIKTSPYIAPNGDIVSPLYAEDMTPPQRLARYSINGARLWTKPHVSDVNAPLLLADSDATYFIDRPDLPPVPPATARKAVSLGNDGTQRWTADLDPLYYWRQLPSARKDRPRPWVLAAPSSSVQSDPATALVRPGPQGLEPLARLRSDVRYLAELADGSLLARALDPSANGALRLIGADGSESSVPAARVPTAQRGAALLSDHDGTFLVVVDESGATQLHHLSNDGTLRWKRALPPRDSTLDNGPTIYYTFELAASPSRVCALRIGLSLTEPAEAACYARDDGSAIYEKTVVPVFRYTESSPNLRIDGAGTFEIVGAQTLSTAEANGSIPIRLARFSLTPQGQIGPSALLAEISHGRGSIVTASANQGQTLAVSAYDSASRETTLSLRGNSNALLWRTQLDGEVHPLAVGSDSSVFAVGRNGFVDLDGSGRQRWSHFATVSRYFFSDTQAFILQPNGDRIVAFVNASDSTTQVMRLGALDGRVAWRQSRTMGPGQNGWGGSLSASPSADLAFFVPGGRMRIGPAKALGFDVQTGDLRTAVYLPTIRRSDNSDEREVRLMVKDDGSVMTVDDRVEFGQIALQSVPREQLLGAASDRLQPSLLGAWSAEDTPGQGLMFDFDPDTRAVFGGWFTYSLDGGHQAAQQRWYSLSPALGGASTDAAEIELAIHRNRGGRFAQGPATSSERVGSARLRQLGCDRALFVYRFDSAEEEGVQGAIPLRRAYARTRACQQAPAEIAGIARPARGIDPRSAGLWYDPAQSGQGLMFDLRPPQDGDAGLVAGAWFTYDLDAQADDPTAQHWFSLAGDLSSAQQGGFEVPIFRTVGGSLDRGATNNTWKVGTATLKFADCSHARLDYAFDDTDVAHAFAGKRGSLSLQRIGGCGD